MSAALSMLPDRTANKPQALPRKRFPLIAKILLLFLFNILLVAGGAFWFVCRFFELDKNWMLDRNARERLQLLAEAIADETESAPRTQWPEILKRHSESSHAELALFGPESKFAAGIAYDLPDEVAKAMAVAVPPAFGPRPETEEAAGAGRRYANKPAFRKEAIKAGGAYWVIVRMPPNPRMGPPSRPPTLVGRITSLGQSALLFNPIPWVAAAAGVLLVTSLLWLPLVRRLSRSLAEMTQAAGSIAEGQFSVKVDASRADEIGQLGSAINAMSERLAGHVSGQRRFLGDIAHELCSPLARMEVALGILETKTPPELHARLHDVAEEVREMRELVGELLSFSKAGFKGVAPEMQRISLAEIVAAAVSRESAGAEILSDVPASLFVESDANLLGRAIGNVLRNAVRYAADCGPIEIGAQRNSNRVLLTIGDHGSGVPEDDLPQLFDPFFRSDLSRTRETGGVGLGLAIVKSCLNSCGASVSAANRPTGGLTVKISIPAAD